MKKIFTLLFVMLVLFQMSCRQLPSATTYSNVTLRLSNFMRDCFAGTASAGTSLSHVHYNVKIRVEEYSSGSYRLTDEYNVPGPITADKSIFEKVIRVPDARTFRISTWLDAIECSKCSQSFCNSYRVNEGGTNYIVNAGRPFWQTSAGFSSIPSGNVIALTPTSAPRNPNSNPPEICDCKIRD